MREISMNTKTIIICLAILIINAAVQSRAEKQIGPDEGATHKTIFDPEKETISIPDTHENPEPYKWNVTLNPKDFGFSLHRSPDGRYNLVLDSTSDAKFEEIHLFVTNRKLEFAYHIIPDFIGKNTYNFAFLAPQKGKYRFETILKTEKGWINFRKDIKLARETEKMPPKTLGPEYEVLIRTVPEKVYSDHITTFIYEIRYKGKPVTDLQKTGGVDMHLFTWNTTWLYSLKEFNYLVPKQNFGGPEVVVSLVFSTPGKQVVFGEFSHLGKKKIIRYEVDVASEDL